MYALSSFVLLVAVATANAGLITGWNGVPVDSAAVLSGPSGTVIRSGLTVPSTLAYSAPASLLASPLAYSTAGLIPGHGLVAGHGLLAGHGLVSGHGLVAGHGLLGARLLAPEGSGLEGQWIPDINEKFYDDGSFKPQIYGY